MKYCPQCGKQLIDEAKFCPQCGKAFAVAAVPPPKPTALPVRVRAKVQDYYVVRTQLPFSERIERGFRTKRLLWLWILLVVELVLSVLLKTATVFTVSTLALAVGVGYAYFANDRVKFLKQAEKILRVCQRVWLWLTAVLIILTLVLCAFALSDADLVKLLNVLPVSDNLYFTVWEALDSFMQAPLLSTLSSVAAIAGIGVFHWLLLRLLIAFFAEIGGFLSDGYQKEFRSYNPLSCMLWLSLFGSVIVLIVNNPLVTVLYAVTGRIDSVAYVAVSALLIAWVAYFKKMHTYEAERLAMQENKNSR